MFFSFADLFDFRLYLFWPSAASRTLKMCRKRLMYHIGRSGRVVSTKEETMMKPYAPYSYRKCVLFVCVFGTFQMFQNKIVRT